MSVQRPAHCVFNKTRLPFLLINNPQLNNTRKHLVLDIYFIIFFPLEQFFIQNKCAILHVIAIHLSKVIQKKQIVKIKLKNCKNRFLKILQTSKFNGGALGQKYYKANKHSSSACSIFENEKYKESCAKIRQYYV